MALIFKLKRFNELSASELYEVLRLRSEVFVVEQNCVYQDIDGKDLLALHLMAYVDQVLVAYSRIFKPGDYFDVSSIGRVVVDARFRGQNYGYNLMEKAILSVAEEIGPFRIHISAQQYLQKFYESLGFKPNGDFYLEDGIPHLGMDRDFEI
jgi:ElaA protein